MRTRTQRRADERRRRKEAQKRRKAMHAMGRLAAEADALGLNPTFEQHEDEGGTTLVVEFDAP